MSQQPVEARGRIKKESPVVQSKESVLPLRQGCLCVSSHEGGTGLLSHRQSCKVEISLCTPGSQVRFPLSSEPGPQQLSSILSGAALSLVSL